MFRGVTLWSGVISGVLSQVRDMSLYSKGDINKQELAVHTTKNVTGAVGIMAGMEYGGVLGSMVFPGVGTVVGCVLGGMFGDYIGSNVGVRAGHMLFQNNQMLLTTSTLPLISGKEPVS
ncbi:outer membrane lipoprotein SlyB [Bacillus fengqiuensis]|nr:outer membrane lipoprotein SlyB [Bacillus fengqiuensis]